MKSCKAYSLFFIVFFLACPDLSAIEFESAGSEKPNVLLIMVDDMNDWVGVFGGHPQAITPNMDKFAEQGIVFKNAYCSAALCNPSRTSMLTGYQPSTTGVYGNVEFFREMEGFENTLTLPQYFSKHGYSTAAAGKIFHNPRGAAEEPKPMSDPGSFQQEHRGNIGTGYPEDQDRMSHGLNLDQRGIHKHFTRSFDWYGIEQSTEETHDWKSADYCAKFLMQKHDKPFFLACGIFRPHLPWYAPQRYFDLYNTEKISLPAILESDLDDVGPIGKNIPQSTLHGEIVNKGKWKEAVHAYLANLSFADDCVGHVLDALKSSQFDRNTIVVIMGDHGWHLGEKLHWSKNVLWEEATKTPLIIFDPRTVDKGFCTRIVSLIDIYPTLVDLCGLPAKNDLEGQSLKPLLSDPGMEWTRPALTSKGEDFHSLRDENYRYTVYKDGFEELYDHRIDPMEWNNIAEQPGNKGVLEDIRRQLDSMIK